jgi:hypothetical protein
MAVGDLYSQSYGYRSDGALGEVRTAVPGEATKVAKLGFDDDGLVTSRSLDGVALETFDRDPETGLVASMTDATNPAGTMSEALTYQNGRVDTRTLDRPAGSLSVDDDYNTAGELKLATTASGTDTSTVEYQ